MNKRTFWKVVFRVSLVGACLCAAAAVWYYWGRFSAEKKYSETRSEVTETGDAADGGAGLSDAPGEDGSADSSPALTIEDIESAEFTGILDTQATKVPEEVITDAEDAPIDFEKLHAINPELYAWIRVPGTRIDYPVAQYMGTDQVYYLHHDLYGNPQFAGCIFSQAPAALDFVDPVTVLYGHNMRNGTMFRGLYEFLDAGVITDSDRYVYIYTAYKTYVYEIYSAFYGDDRNITAEYDFTDAEVLEKYIEGTLHPRDMNARVKPGVEVTTDDRILVLSTCVAGQTSERVLVHAVLLYEEDRR